MQTFSTLEMELGRRFHYTMKNFGYWDIPVWGLRRLTKIGLVEHPGCGRYAIANLLDEIIENEELLASEVSLP